MDCSQHSQSFDLVERVLGYLQTEIPDPPWLTFNPKYLEPRGLLHQLKYVIKNTFTTIFRIFE